ncbi:MAG: TIGR00341 family protein [Acidimicrobiaceae bacterium]|nr:TIGR00341 family protein [Acidimicrobiaceae bacterium]
MPTPPDTGDPDRSRQGPVWTELTADPEGGTSEAGPESSDDPSLGIHRARRHRWWHRHLDSEERKRVMAELAIRREDHWTYRFSVMQTLSVVVAVMGLSADSPAVVIGAMLLAPLMQPVLGIAACISMALFKNALRAMLVVVLATAWSVLLSYWLAAIFINGELPDEVRSRTAPDIRDLVVALGAGAAGAYATVRKDVSSSLPGVAVAVALVPPLGVLGITLQAGNATFAWGALLLYVTNLFAIVLAGVLVFVVTGFVPPRRLATTFRRSALVSAVVAVIVVAVALPLYGASTAAVEASEREVEALDIVSVWLGSTDRRSAPEVEFDATRITVTVRSFDSPPDPEPLITALQSSFGADRVVSIEWDRVDQPTTTTEVPPTTIVVSDEEVREAQVTDIVDQWLVDLGPEASGRRDLLSITDNVIRLDASGTIDAPSLSSLTQALDEQLDRTFEVQLTWLVRENVSDAEPPAPDEVIADQVTTVARAWAAPLDVTVVATNWDGELATVELAGSVVPDASDLVAELAEVVGDDDAVRILFVEQLDITRPTTTTSTTTTSTTVPVTTPVTSTSTAPAPSSPPSGGAG